MTTQNQCIGHIRTYRHILPDDHSPHSEWAIHIVKANLLAGYMI